MQTQTPSKLTITSYQILILCAGIFTGSFAQGIKYPTTEIEPFYDLHFTSTERDSLMDNLKDFQKAFTALHHYKIDNSIPMSLIFDPVPVGFHADTRQQSIEWGLPAIVKLPAHKDELAFYPVYKLSVLLKNRQITSTELTMLYLSRLKKFADTLQCAIVVLEETALKAAQKADEEIAKGIYRGPLHGIPYGVKDLLAVEGTETTWGAAPYRRQVIAETATVVKKLETAGAVLIVKLTMGALAMGDIWYGGITKNPWDLKQGSSGSSAGSASATVAGLVGFAIGTETLGSIVSPSNRCGATGLRPSFGRVSRHGAMALSWSMDKIGPITRSTLDAAIVFNAIRGSDGLDHHVREASFNYKAGTDLKKLKVGYLKSLFDSTYTSQKNDQEALKVIQSLGVNLVPVELPATIPVDALLIMLEAEAAAAFDELTRSDRDSLLTDQRRFAWPNTFRAARFIPAVEYINASRIRSQLVQQFHEAVKSFDVIIAPTFEGSQLLTTNLTGTPCLVVPNGFNAKGSPTSISFIGKLYGEASLVVLGRAYQEATDWDERIPPLFK